MVDNIENSSEYWGATNQLLNWLKDEHNPPQEDTFFVEENTICAEEKPTCQNIFNLPFNMRQKTMKNFSNQTNFKTSRSHNIASMRAKRGRFQSSFGSLTILQKIIQKSINEEIDAIIQKYLKEFFQPAINNIVLNLPNDTITRDYQQIICQQILIEAMQMYGKVAGDGFVMSQSSDIDSDHGSLEEPPGARLSKMLIKRKKTKSTSSDSSSHIKQESHPIRQQPNQESHKQLLISNVEISSETIFVMGSKANKALGLGATRGRLYTKHPFLFKYPVDQVDKQWLCDTKLITPTAGRMYLLLIDQVTSLAKTEEYRRVAQQSISELIGFKAPVWMLDKIKRHYNSIIDTTVPPFGSTPPQSHIEQESTDDLIECKASACVLDKAQQQLDETTDAPFLDLATMLPQALIPTRGMNETAKERVETDFIVTQEDYALLNDDNGNLGFVDVNLIEDDEDM